MTLHWRSFGPLSKYAHLNRPRTGTRLGEGDSLPFSGHHGRCKARGNPSGIPRKLQPMNVVEYLGKVPAAACKSRAARISYEGPRGQIKTSQTDLGKA